MELLEDPILIDFDCSEFDCNTERLLVGVYHHQKKAINCLYKDLKTYMMGTLIKDAGSRREYLNLVIEAFHDALVVFIRKIQEKKYVWEGENCDKKQASMRTYFYKVYGLIRLKKFSKNKRDWNKIGIRMSQLQKDLPLAEEVDYKQDRNQFVSEAMKMLKPKCQKIMTQKLYDELSNKEIGGNMNEPISNATLRVRITRCRDALIKYVINLMESES